MRAQTTTGVLPGALSLVQGEEQTTQSARGGEDGGCRKTGEAEGLDWSLIILSCRDNLSGGGNFDNTPK